MPVVDAVGLLEGTGRFQGVGKSTPWLVTMAEAPTITGAQALGWNLRTTQAQSLAVAAGAVMGYPKTLAQAYGPAAAWGILVTLGRTIAETYAAQDTLDPRASYAPTLDEIHTVATALVSAYPKTMAETTQIAAVASVVRGMLMLEGLNLATGIDARGSYQFSLAETLAVSDTLRRFFGGDMLETLGMATTQLPQPKFARSVAETLGVAATLTQSLVIRVTAAETIGLDDVDVLKLIMTGQMLEGVEIAAAYIGPNSNFTTWAVNTRTGATTEYTNYVFNSFAQMGHKYLAASDDGLYELNGSTDQGTSIIGRLRSGFAQFGGSRFSSFKAAYLGFRAAGNVIFRLIDGNGKTYTYQVISRNMQTTKVNLGKGLRARYFAYEIESTGQDFDLDSIELVPLVAQRRV